MKNRYWRVIAIAIVLVILAGFIYLPRLINMGDPHLIAPNTLVTPEKKILQACEPSQGNYVGPLVPDQNTPKPSISVAGIEPDEAIQSSEWDSRSGFSISSATDPEYWAQMLGSGWYLDWSVKDKLPESGLEHWQMIRVHEDCISPSPEKIQKSAAAYPGQVWIIGNEPDVIWQDNVTPARYAIYYHELYQLIKSSDPSALIAVGGISQPTHLRLQYLDQVLEAYQNLYHEAMPADWWTVHGYVLREEKDSWGVEIPPGINATKGELYEVSDHGRLDLFEAQLISFRQWMKDNGYQDTPLALTEFGILMPTSYGFPLESIADYLEQTFTWLYETKDESTGYPVDTYHLVQKWAWFSISDPNYSSADLGDIATGKLTQVGEQFRTVVSTKGP